MKTAFVILGIILIVLFLAWIVLARPEKEKRRTVLVLDIALIMASAAVLTAGFMMRDRHMADMAAWDGGEADDSQEVHGQTIDEVQEPENSDKPPAGQGSGEPAGPQGTEDRDSQGTGNKTGSGNQGIWEDSRRQEESGSEGEEIGEQGTESGQGSQAPGSEGREDSRRPEDGRGAQEDAPSTDLQEGNGTRDGRDARESGQASPAGEQADD